MKTYQFTKLVAALASVGLAGVAGAQAQSSAISVNPDGLGEALIYPFYTAQNGNATLLSVVNTSDAGKVVKIRFREYANSEDVRDFNIYMSAKDVWTGAVLAVGSGGMTGTGGWTGQGGSGAMIVTQDSTCTAPNKTAWQDVSADFGGTTSYAVPFSKSDYQGNDDATRGANLAQTIERVTRGYFEVIEQATIPTNSTMYQRIDHRVAGQNGKPNCAALHSFPSSASPMVNTTYGYTQYTGTTLTAPSGGLFGSAAWLNTGNGASSAVEATAMNGFTRSANVYNPGDTRPNFTDHLSTRTVVTTADKVVVVDLGSSPTAAGLNPAVPNMWAATAPLFATNVYGEYAYSSDLALSTDWVITMPGKRHFVTFPGTGGAGDAYAPTATTTVPPFANASYWRTAASAGAAQYTSPVEISAATYDREEQYVTPPGCVFSPCDRLTVDTNSLPHESNVIAFGPSGASSSAASGAMSANKALWLLGVIQTPVVGGGWLDLSFANTRSIVGSSVAGVTLQSGTTIAAGTNNVTFNGLPVIGFQATSAKSITGNINASYRHSSALAQKKSVAVN